MLLQSTLTVRLCEKLGGNLYIYDFALSFAGEDRETAERVASALKRHGVRVFYDADYTADLLGKDLAVHFAKLYRDDAQFCVVFLSQAYLDKLWCKWERRAAIARAFGSATEYLLPYRLEPVDLPSIPGTIGRADAGVTNPEEFASLLVKKLYIAQQAIEPIPGLLVQVPNPHQMRLRGSALQYEMDDYGYLAEVIATLLLRNVTPDELRVRLELITPKGGGRYFHTVVPAMGTTTIDLPIAEALRSGDGALETNGAVSLDAIMEVEKANRPATLESALATAFASGLVQYELRFTEPGSAVVVLVHDRGAMRLHAAQP